MNEPPDNNLSINVKTKKKFNAIKRHLMLSFLLGHES